MRKNAKKYIADNLCKSFGNSPFNKRALPVYFIISIYFFIAAIIGISGETFRFEMLDSKLVYILPITLFVFPSLLEESFFRGVLIPIDTRDKGKSGVIFFTMLSTIAFVLWHPLNALTINPKACEVFLDPYFLIITGLLGITCSISYIYSRSIWLAILVHWLTVVIWVLFLGGRNKILEIPNT